MARMRAFAFAFSEHRKYMHTGISASLCHCVVRSVWMMWYLHGAKHPSKTILRFAIDHSSLPRAFRLNGKTCISRWIFQFGMQFGQHQSSPGLASIFIWGRTVTECVAMDGNERYRPNILVCKFEWINFTSPWVSAKFHVVYALLTFTANEMHPHAVPMARSHIAIPLYFQCHRAIVSKFRSNSNVSAGRIWFWASQF